jgi:N-acetyl-gamma-glutamyl-phosphate reductase
MSVVPFLLENCGKVIDFSADYRLKDVSVYEEWYSTKHTSPELCDNAIYGLPELNGEKIKKGSLIANPGCFSTNIILGTAPLLKEKLIHTKSIIVDSKSGISGAGKKADTYYSFPERCDSVVAYNVAHHRHIPEIEQELSSLSKSKITFTFTPQLIPMSRGIHSNIYADLKNPLSLENLINIYQSFYKDNPFIRILEKGVGADTKNVKGSNFCDLSVHIDRRNGRVIISSVIDNLVKGASGQAVQNMNLMFGLNEQRGLKLISLVP